MDKDQYGIFSISPTHRASLEQYIGNQEEHHRKVTFQDEYRRLLNKYGIHFDERYVWDWMSFRPFRAWYYMMLFTQGVALGYLIVPLWGKYKVRIKD